MKKLLFSLFIYLSFFSTASSSPIDSIENKVKPFDIPSLKWNFKKDENRFLQFNIMGQIWTRYVQSNPGTLTDKKITNHTFDIGIRRLRFWAIVQPTYWLRLAVQFGLNNFNSQSARKSGAFFHDAYIEFNPLKNYFAFGAGLSAWRGHARYSAPSTGNILTLDAPLYQQSTNDINDEFLRTLNLYIHGDIGKFSYRASVSNPLSLKNTPYANPQYNATDAKYTDVGRKLMYSSYLQFYFFDLESHKMPYAKGSHLGTKKLLVLGAGIEAQPKATATITKTNDTLYHNAICTTVDLLLDMPLSKQKHDNFTAYVAYTYSNFGPNYLRNIGAMNPSKNVNSNSSFNGPGNAYPTVGTGHTIYSQAAYMMPKEWFGKRGITFQPFADIQASKFQKLNSWMLCYNAGINLLLVNNKAKISLSYQNRPIFDKISLIKTANRNALIIQFQVAI